MAQLFERTPRSAEKRSASANTALDGSGTLTSLMTGVASPGSRVRKVNFTLIAASPRNRYALVLYDGTDHRLIPGTVVTVSEKDFDSVVGDTPVCGSISLPDGEVLLPSASHILKLANYTGDNTDVIIEGGDFA